ncbi:MAG: hypothetical protein LBK56_10825 [Gracilibacteraceae bacterium]|jgi:hypothetical protein|nr:hypothetical protein [Gracilibacteraceae bacterium]
MIYLWEAMLSEIAQGRDPGDMTYIPPETISPYWEITLPDINGDPRPGEPLELNGYYRYLSVFIFLMGDRARQEHPELARTLFDMFAHIIGWCNLREGLSRAEYEKIFLREYVESGGYGAGHADIFTLLSIAETDALLSALRSMLRSGTFLSAFIRILRRLYPGSGCYLDPEYGRRLLVYLGYKRSAENERKIAFLRDVFVALDIEVVIFWDKHFGIIGVDETMEPGEIMLY